ncbi:hypothetical protein OHA74_21645 [Streptomyces phaeochromogenes]|uniref:hypothetical protein n=1 Tax=Streptomyces phaeochromogenes TaxID=1923 RepID=UPI002E2D2F55|nr:hypothetical protein [Streptomyces phaeochromogenes]
MSTFQFADAGWVAITAERGGRIGIKPVRMFELSESGVTALTKDADGAMVPDPDVVEVINTDPLHAAKLAVMHHLNGLVEKAMTAEELDGVERLADWVIDWEPRRG